MADPTKDFSFFFGARCAHADCPGSHLWQSTGIIKNHQPINFFLSCGQYPASPRTFFFFFRLLIGFFFLLVKKKKEILFIYLHGASEESWPRRRWTVDHHLSGFVCGFFKVDLHSWPCDEGVWLVTQAEENFFLPVCGCSPLTLLTNLHHERNLSPRSELVCGACYECVLPLSISISSVCVNNPLTC